MNKSEEVQQASVRQHPAHGNEINTKLEDENTFLKDQVVRLNRELSIYHKNVGILPPSDSNDHGIDLPESIPDCEVMAPLFATYDHRIKELSSFIEKQGSVLDLLTQRSNDLLSENQNLRNRIIQGLPVQLAEKTKEVNVNNNKEVNLNQLLSDKHLLEEQAELLARELQCANKSIASRDESISSLTDQVKSKLTSIQHLNEKVQQLFKEKGDCEKELLCRIKKLSIQQIHIAELNTRIDKLNEKQSCISSKVESVGIDKNHLEAENETLIAKVCTISI